MEPKKLEAYRGLISQRIRTLATIHRQAIRNASHKSKTKKQSETDVLDQDVDHVKQAISDLEQVVVEYGLSNDHVTDLMEIILEVSNRHVFGNAVKARMIRCLLPVKKLSNEVILNIVASIGINTKEKQFVHKNIQMRLIRWVYLNICIDNINDYTVLKALAPMLFNLCKVEYVLQYVALILIKLLARFKNDKVFIKSMLRPWRLEHLIQLDAKLNNMDPYLLMLIVLFEEFKQKGTGSGEFLRDHFKVSQLVRDKRIAILKLPSLKYVSNLIRIKMANNEGNLTLDDEFIENVALSLQTFDSLNSVLKRKRRKLETSAKNGGTVEPLINDMIGAICHQDQFNNGDNDLEEEKNDERISVMDFIEGFTNADGREYEEDVQMGKIIFKFARLKKRHLVEIGELIEIATVDTRIYQYLFKIDQYHEKINRWSELMLVHGGKITITQNNKILVNEVIQGLLNIQTITGHCYEIFDKILTNNVIIEYEQDDLQKQDEQIFLFDKSKLLKKITSLNLHHHNKTSALSALFVSYLLVSKDRDNVINSGIQSLNFNLRSSYKKHDITAEQFNQIYRDVLCTVVENLSSSHDSNTRLSIELRLIFFIRQIEILSFDKIEIDNLIKSPIIFNFMILSNNPVIISEFCKHIMFTKRYFSEYYSTLTTKRDDDELFKNLHNSYVMDFCNLFWRNKALEFRVNSSSKAMLLPSQFINGLQNISIETDDLMMIDFFFKKSFGINLHPAFVNIVTNTIIRELEDQDMNCDIRFAGPIDETNFHNFIRNNRLNWIKLNDNNNSDIINEDDLFNQFKIMILRKIDKIESINGISDLLFNSLKTLLHKRHE